MTSPSPLPSDPGQPEARKSPPIRSDDRLRFHSRETLRFGARLLDDGTWAPLLQFADGQMMQGDHRCATSDEAEAIAREAAEDYIRQQRGVPLQVGQAEHFQDVRRAAAWRANHQHDQERNN